MEISATSSSSFMTAQFSETRAVRPVMREPLSSQDGASAVSKDRKNMVERQPSLSNNSEAQKLLNNSQVSASQVARGSRAEAASLQTRQANEVQRTQQQGNASPERGGIKVDIEGGQRVTKVFDNKDVLIYQVPAKGALQLIQAQESSQQSQVRAVA